MAIIEKRNAIHRLIESVVFEQEHRNYIGYSSVGGSCRRKQWYDYRGSYKRKISMRISRLLKRGHSEEAVIVSNLEFVGMKVHSQQKEVINKEFPELRGHIDGIVIGVPDFPMKQEFLLEMKTANKSNFELMKKLGIRHFSNTYWVQIHGYMKELGLKKCLYVVTNKNDEERLYLIIDFDPDALSDIKYIVGDILSPDIPPQIGSRTWFECKFCSAYGICHGDEEMEVLE